MHKQKASCKRELKGTREWWVERPGLVMAHRAGMNPKRVSKEGVGKKKKKKKKEARKKKKGSHWNDWGGGSKENATPWGPLPWASRDIYEGEAFSNSCQQSPSLFTEKTPAG